MAISIDAMNEGWNAVGSVVDQLPIADAKPLNASIAAWQDFYFGDPSLHTEANIQSWNNKLGVAGKLADALLTQTIASNKVVEPIKAAPNNVVKELPPITVVGRVPTEFPTWKLIVIYGAPLIPGILLGLYKIRRYF
jgi:hypothetical protein